MATAPVGDLLRRDGALGQRRVVGRGVAIDLRKPEGADVLPARSASTTS